MICQDKEELELSQSVPELIEQLPEPAKNWVNRLYGAERQNMVRLLKDVGPENFGNHWQEHEQELATSNLDS